MTTTIAPTTFHFFPQLPFEIRARIWEMSVESRIVDVRVIKDYSSSTTMTVYDVDGTPRLMHAGARSHLRSSTTVLAQLQTCREARELLTTHHKAEYRYERAFSELINVSPEPYITDPPQKRGLGSKGRSSRKTRAKAEKEERRLRIQNEEGGLTGLLGFVTLQPDSQDSYTFVKRSETGILQGFDNAPESDPEKERYVWFNFEIDIFSIGETDLGRYTSVAHQIHRLRLERDLDREEFDRSDTSVIVTSFRNLLEMYIVCLAGISQGHWLSYSDWIPCKPEKMFLIDPDGTMMSTVELDALRLEECLAENAVEDLEGCIPDELWERLMMEQAAGS